MYGQFFVIIAMILTGYLMRKINFIKKEMNNSLNKLIVYCAYPCMLAYNIGRMKMDRKIFCEFIWMMLITVIVMMSFALIMKFYAQIRRFPSRVSNVAELSMVYPNNGFMGFPIALSLLGSKGLLFMMAQNSAMNVMFFTHTMKVLHRNEKNKNNVTVKSIVKNIVMLLLNPNILAMFVGLALCFGGISLDNPVGTYLQYIGNAATPMAMIFIGSTLAESHILEMINNHIIWESSISKLILMPLFATVAVYFLPISDEMKIIMILGACLPTAATVPMLAEQEGQSHELASKILFFVTVLSMTTVPLSMTLIKVLFHM